MNTQMTTVEQWDIFEITLEVLSTGNPFKDVQLSGEFSYQNRSLTLEGFFLWFIRDRVGDFGFHAADARVGVGHKTFGPKKQARNEVHQPDAAAGAGLAAQHIQV